ncbi:MAG: hypothetical protein H0U89_11305, partial [Acidimicrobiia bacterium]|nr:hypothetical protein [Acidimicrobiia bacterium]
VRVLGSIVVELDGREVPLGGPRQRAVLARLVLAERRLVPVDPLMRRLVEEARATRPGTAYLELDPDTLGMPDDSITVVLDVSRHLERRLDAIVAHRSQASPYDDLSDALRWDFLGTDHLIRLVPAPGHGERETSLFA